MKLEKIMQKLDKDTQAQMEAMSPDSLKQLVVEAEMAQKQAKEELDKNPAYQRAKADLKDLRAGLNEVNKRQKLKIAYALYLLEQ